MASVVACALALSKGGEIDSEAIVMFPRKASGNRSETTAVPLTGGLRRIERYIIDSVIKQCRGNKAAAARVLGLHRRTLYRLLENADDARAAELGDEA